MTVGTANFAELLWPGIQKIWGDTYEAHPSIYTKFMPTVSSDKAFEKYQQITGLPPAGVKNQGAPMNFLDPMQGYQKEMINVSYALGSSVTKEMYDDEQYSVINRIPAMLADSLRYTEEVIGHSLLNNALTTEHSADGVTILNVSHPLVGGGTLSNRGQNGVTYELSQTTLEIALGTFIARWTDDRGKFRVFEGLTLVVPSDMKFRAEKILQTEYEVGTGNNTINPVKGKLNLVASPFITDTDAFYIITNVTSRDKQGLLFQRREDASVDRDNEFTTKTMLFSTYSRFTVGCADWRGVWGSPGA